MVQYLYIYVVARDFGFAPNPFHGYCTLATCKPKIRGSAKIGDWIMGVGGSRLKATGRCIYLMKVSEVLTFNDYWSDIRFQKKKPLRNGSLVMMVGDNIYHKEIGTDFWIQEDSHHSNPDGSPNVKNLKTDTKSINVLVSNQYYYFGNEAPVVDYVSIEYKNHRSYRKYMLNDGDVYDFIEGLIIKYKKNKNLVVADPYDFAKASKRVNQHTGKIS